MPRLNLLHAGQRLPAARDDVLPLPGPLLVVVETRISWKGCHSLVDVRQAATYAQMALGLVIIAGWEGCHVVAVLSRSWLMQMPVLIVQVLHWETRFLVLPVAPVPVLFELAVGGRFQQLGIRDAV